MLQLPVAPLLTTALAPEHTPTLQMALYPCDPFCSYPSSTASQLRMCSVWWIPMESSGLPSSQASPALALSSGPIRATPYKWVPRGKWEGEPGGTPVDEVLTDVHSHTHSQVPELELMPLETPQALPLMLVHGTFWKHWPSILLKGLSCQGRAHIHLASGLPGDPGVISGQCPPPKVTTSFV